MNIAINGSQLTDPQPAGPENYALNIILGLGKIDKVNTYTIFLPGTIPPQIASKIRALPKNFVIKIIPKILSWTQISLAISLWKERYDVLFSPVHTIPIIALPRVKTVSVIHGLEFLTNQKEKTFWEKITKGLPEKVTCMLSNQLIVPSKATRDSIMKMGWKLKNKEIIVIPEGVSEIFERTDSQKNSQPTPQPKSLESPIYPESPISSESRVNGNLNIPRKPYLIFISTIQPRKNLKSIVQALSILKKNFGEEINLVVCGKKGWKFEEELSSPEKFGVKDQVFFMGRVSDENLAALLRCAKAFISASFDEGFGLPVLESMTAKIPLIISDIPAYRDLAEDSAIYIDPYSPMDIANKIHFFINENREKIEKRTSKAYSLAKNYSWKKSAKEIKEILKSFENQYAN